MIDRVIGILGLLLGLGLWVVQNRWGNIPKWVTDIGLVLSGVLIGIACAPTIYLPSLVEPVSAFSDVPATRGHFSLRLQFQGGAVVPVEMSRENVLSWYIVWGPQITSILGSRKGKLQEQVSMSRIWTVVIMLSKPLIFGRAVADCRQCRNVNFSVKWSNGYYLVIQSDGDVPAGIVELHSNL